MEQKKATDAEQELQELQDSLDQYTFGKETVDVDKIKEIVSRMDEILEADTQEFQKEEVWDQICTSYSEEDMKEEEAEKREAGRDGGKRVFGITRKKKDFYRASVLASVIVLAVFIGANVGTYATEKKNVFEIVDEWRNGTAFRVNGDVESLDTDREGQIFYSWNEIPNDYRGLILLPSGMPEDFELYRIRVNKIDTLNICEIRYTDSNGIKNFDVEVVDYSSGEFAFHDLLVEETEYHLLKEEVINDFVVNFYENPDNEYVVRFTDDAQWYTFYSNLSFEVLENIVCKTIEKNF